MPEHVWFEEWRDEKVGSLYPFADTATLTSQGGSVTLSRDMFTDATLYPIGGGPRMYITRLVVPDSRQVIIYVGTAANKALASCTFDPLAPPTQLSFTDAKGRPAGLLLCDQPSMSVAQSWLIGEYSFAAGATEFAASCCIPVPASYVQGFLLDDGSLLTKDVWLVGENGVTVSWDGANIRIDVTGEPLYARQQCADSGQFSTPTLVKQFKITSGSTSVLVPPDAFGNFDLHVGSGLAADTVLRLSGEQNVLTISTVGQAIKG